MQTIAEPGPAATPSEEYDRLGLHDRSDDELLDLAASLVAEPRVAPADSFALHAPLELLARRGLLGLVDPHRREDARRRLHWVATTFRDTGTPIGPPGHEQPDAGRLVDALAAGDLDVVDAQAAAFASAGAFEAVDTVASAIAASLAAAGHAPIYAYLLPRVAPRSLAALATMRPLLREVARHPDMRLTWMDEPFAVPSGAEAVDVLLSTPYLGVPGSDFIFPIMHQAERSGVAKQVVPSVLASDPLTVRRVLSRVAAWSMLQDDPAAAPYGWSHCLTMPQALAAIAPRLDEPLRALAVAATFTVGFRTSQGRERVVPRYEPEPVGWDPVEALDAPPDVAAAAAFHAKPEREGALVTALATRAALHEDAHLAKYTLACFDAAAADAQARSLYVAAAAYLSAWWAQR